jgi:hypothetical protein
VVAPVEKLDPRTRLCRELLEKLWMPWPELMLLRILHQVYHIQIKAIAVIATSTMYTLESSLAVSKVDGRGPMQTGQAEPGSQTPGNTGVRTAPRLEKKKRRIMRDESGKYVRLFFYKLNSSHIPP